MYSLFPYFLLLGFVLSVPAARAENAPSSQPSSIRFGKHNYIEYRVGDLPLIITAGHGGDLTPADIPDRAYGVTATDANTRELAIACAEAVAARTGGRHPHLVLCHLARRKLDVNRRVEEAAQGAPAAIAAWEEFHDFVGEAIAGTTRSAGFAFLVDLHGHGHATARVELGYALGAPELDLDDHQLNQLPKARETTLRPLALANPSIPIATLVRGPGSIGDLFNRAGIPAWPSPQFPSPGEADFFNGGYIVRTHSGAKDDRPVSSVQVETPRNQRSTPEARARFAAAFADVMLAFLKHRYDYSPSPVVPPSPAPAASPRPLTSNR